MEAIGQLAAVSLTTFNNLLTINKATPRLQLATPGHNADTIESLTRLYSLGARRRSYSPTPWPSAAPDHAPARTLLNTLIKGLLGMLRRVLGERISVSVISTTSCRLIFADHDGIEQVVMNLTLNARDACRRAAPSGLPQSPPSIRSLANKRLRRRSPASMSAFRSAIRAPGWTNYRALASSSLLHYQRVKQRNGHGTRRTVYGIARQHEGWVDVTTAPGDGSTSPSAPRDGQGSRARRESRGAAQSEREDGEASGHTILIVEDDHAVRSLVKEIAEHHRLLGHRG
jgi:hypothetical protein